MIIPFFRALLFGLYSILSLSSSGIIPSKQAEYVQCTAPVSKHDLEFALNLTMTAGKETDDGSIFVKYLDKFKELDENTERRIYFRISYIPITEEEEREDKYVMPDFIPAVFLPAGHKCLVTRVGVLIEDWKKALLTYEDKQHEGFRILQTGIDDFGLACDPDGIPNSMRIRTVEETLDSRILKIGKIQIADLSQPEDREIAQKMYNQSINEILQEYALQEYAR